MPLHKLLPIARNKSCMVHFDLINLTNLFVKCEHHLTYVIFYKVVHFLLPFVKKSFWKSDGQLVSLHRLAQLTYKLAFGAELHPKFIFTPFKYRFT